MARTKEEVLASIAEKRAESAELLEQLGKSTALCDMYPEAFDSTDNHVSCYWMYRGERFDPEQSWQDSNVFLYYPRASKPRTTRHWVFVVVIKREGTAARYRQFAFEDVSVRLWLEGFDE